MAELIPLEQVYLSCLAEAAKSLKMDTVLQELGTPGGAFKPGRLWFVATGSTVPLGMLEFEFGKDSVALNVVTRDERILERAVKYAEGIDAYLQEFVQLFQAGRLADKRSKA